MRTYRVDRMKDISFTCQPREGEEAFKKVASIITLTGPSRYGRSRITIPRICLTLPAHSCNERERGASHHYGNTAQYDGALSVWIYDSCGFSEADNEVNREWQCTAIGIRGTAV